MLFFILTFAYMHPLYHYIKKELSALYAEEEASSMAKWTLMEAFHFTPLELYGGKDTNLSPDRQHQLKDIVCRLKRHEPLQYVLGRAGFGNLSLHVAPGVLIPRPETEELVEWISTDHPEPGLRILDIGTGSGCIAIALATLCKEASVTAWDISPDALRIARDNAEANGVEVDFNQVDVMQLELPRMSVDILVSNPPYIKESEQDEMEANVLAWEPHQALFVPDDDPLRFYRRIAQAGHELLASGGALYFEINRLYGQETIGLLKEAGYHSVQLRKDLSGNDRMVKAIHY